MTSLFRQKLCNYLMISGKNLKELLKKEGLTQQEFADKVGKSRATVITWLGKAKLDDDVVFYIQQRLGIDLSFTDSTNTGSASTSKEIQLLNEIIADLRERVEELKKDKARLQERLDVYEGVSKTGTN